jgi:hypothetical protein
MRPLLKAAGIGQLHYTGGVSSDAYDWQTNKDITQCPGTATSEFTAPCAKSDALDFATFSQNARALNAQSLITVNYGTGTPAIAAAWVAQAKATPSQAVADWEIGNESYGCWENNNWLADAPANYAGYVPNTATCPMSTTELGPGPGLDLVAQSYAAHAGDYLTAMKKADPNAKIGVPWAFDGGVGGAAVADNNEWNDTILKADGANISFVDAHWYAFGFPGNMGAHGNPTAQQVIQSVFSIPSEYAKIRGTLNTYDPGAQVIVGETGVSFLPTNAPCTPAGALFSAGDALSWLAAGAQTVDWWPVATGDNKGNACNTQDEAMFTGTGVPTSMYYGYKLAAALAQPMAQLSTLTTSDNADVLAFQSVLPGGQVVVALINTNTSGAKKVSFGSSLSGYLATQSYAAAGQNAANNTIVTGQTTANAVAGGVTLPAESILILKELKPAAITLGGASKSVKAGTKVTLTGKLTLNGATAPAGVSVQVRREVSGKTQATLKVKTAAGGTYTVTDTPPGVGSYVYSASYTSNTYEPVSASYAMQVTARKPALKLAVSAKSVKPGQKVTVTATLGASHTDRTLAIYAQPKGHAKQLIKRATINAKGQVVVVYRVTVNTTFTVTFAGDAWYGRGSATATVTA